MDDQEVLTRIKELVDEEHALERAHIGEGLAPEEHQRMQRIEVALDQCWDYLRQRRARRDAGEDPETAQLRPPEIVETYDQ
ncbi:MAG TPA: DUF2630 family protein [Egibacteraceae bacterium]|nr:DUF2630 family protein [Egibacteraceae bacterium]